MRLELCGKINTLYVQSLCMMFFRGEKFPENEENPKGVLKVIANNLENGIEVQAILSYNGQDASAKSYVELLSGETPERISKIAVGQAVFDACVTLTGYRPPWGLLTGIRPSLVAKELIDKHGEEKAYSILCELYYLSSDKASLAIDVAKYESEILEKYDGDTCSLYVSIPFCPTRCTYCSFISYATKKLFDLLPNYVDRIVADIEKTVALIKEKGLKISTVYVGGGTPTTLNPSQLERVLGTISASVDVTMLDEFTVECGRPDTITAEKLEVLKKYGVSRVSVNPQSLNDSVLVEIGRKHTVKDFFDAYSLVSKSGIKVVNTDLIAGLDGDDFESFKRTVDQIVKLNPDNVTVHTFSVKKSAQILQDNKEIYHNDGEIALKSVEYAFRTLSQNGYLPYYMYRQKNTISDLENVGYAKKGTFCMYNVLMMGDGHTVFGIGAGATTKLVSRANGKTEIYRIFSPKYPYEYLQDNQNYFEKMKEFFERGNENENN